MTDERRCGWCDGCRWGGPCRHATPYRDLGDSAGGFDLAQDRAREPETPQDAPQLPAQLPTPTPAASEPPEPPERVQREADALLVAAHGNLPHVHIASAADLNAFARYAARLLERHRPPPDE